MKSKIWFIPLLLLPLLFISWENDSVKEGGFTSSAFAGDTEKISVIWVIDGDTFISRHNSKVYRLWGVDAPEHDQPWGNAAREALTSLVHQKSVNVEIKGESWGRPVVKATTTNGRDVGLELLKMGLAWHTPEYAPSEEAYIDAHNTAKSAGTGLWSDRKPVNPKEWRKPN